MSIQRINFNGEHDDGGWLCYAVDALKIENTNAELIKLLNLAWESIQEAGYEDHCNELREKIWKHLT